MLCRGWAAGFPELRRNPRQMRCTRVRAVSECQGWGAGWNPSGGSGEIRAGSSVGSGASVGEVVVGGGRKPRAEAEEAVEGGPPVASAVPAENEPVQIALQVPAAQPVVHADGPAPQIRKHLMGSNSGPRGPLGRRPHCVPAGSPAGWHSRSSRR